MMRSMNAVMVRRFGGPEVLSNETAAIPECGADEVLVHVQAAGVGPWDAWVRGGRSAVPQPLPLIPGSDIAGIAAAVGSEVTGIAAGDAVYGATNARFTNGYAEFAPCNGTMVARKPASLSFAEAASAPVIAVTAWQMLFDHAGLTRGQAVLVHGAAGNVGRYAVQIARDAGLEVLATGSSRDAERLKELGAVRIVDASAPDVAVDAVLDLVGGESQSALPGWLGRGGALISAVGRPDAGLAAERGIRAAFILVDVRRATLEKLAALFDAGTIGPWVGEVLPLAEARAAHEMLAGNRAHRPGKIVLRP